MKLVIIDWVDSCAGRGWRETDWYDANSGALKCRSVGYVIKETKDDLHLVAHLGLGGSGGKPDQATGDMCIPKRAITRTRKLREPK